MRTYPSLPNRETRVVLKVRKRKHEMFELGFRQYNLTSTFWFPSRDHVIILWGVVYVNFHLLHVHVRTNKNSLENIMREVCLLGKQHVQSDDVKKLSRCLRMKMNDIKTEPPFDGSMS